MLYKTAKLKKDVYSKPKWSSIKWVYDFTFVLDKNNIIIHPLKHPQTNCDWNLAMVLQGIGDFEIKELDIESIAI
jgi:hypothetical protein